MGAITTLPGKELAEAHFREAVAASRDPPPREGEGLTQTRSPLEFAGCASDVSPRGEVRSAHLARLSEVPCKSGRL